MCQREREKKEKLSYWSACPYRFSALHTSSRDKSEESEAVIWMETEEETTAPLEPEEEVGVINRLEVKALGNLKFHLFSSTPK